MAEPSGQKSDPVRIAFLVGRILPWNVRNIQEYLLVFTCFHESNHFVPAVERRFVKFSCFLQIERAMEKPWRSHGEAVQYTSRSTVPNIHPPRTPSIPRLHQEAENSPALRQRIDPGSKETCYSILIDMFPSWIMRIIDFHQSLQGSSIIV